MSKIIISGYYGFENTGDEAILLGIISNIRAVNKPVDICVLSRRPEITASRYGVRAINRNNFRAIIQEIKRCDLFLSGGGSLLQDITGWKSIPYYLGLVLIAQLMGKKTAFYAQGIGPVRGTLGRLLIKFVGNRTDLITVRDEASKELLVELGVDQPKIKITVDPVFGLAGKAGYIGKINKNSQLDNIINKDKPVIGVSVRPWGDSEYIKNLASGLNYLSDLSGGQFLIIPMHYYQDKEISYQLKKLLDRPAVVLEKQYTPAGMLSLFSYLDLLVGVRLHSLIFAALNSIPFLGISYDPKVDNFINMVRENYVIDIEDPGVDLLKDTFNRLWSDREAFSKRLDNRLKEYREVALQNAELALNLIEGGYNHGNRK